MGNVANWQQHLMPTLLTQPGNELAEILGEQLPSDAMPSTLYEGPPGLIVPTIRTNLNVSEDLKLNVIILTQNKPRDAALYWRPIGEDNFNRITLGHIARGVCSARIPRDRIQKRDLEYYIKVSTAEGSQLVFPSSAPKINQTVVIMGG